MGHAPFNPAIYQGQLPCHSIISPYQFASTRFVTHFQDNVKYISLRTSPIFDRGYGHHHQTWTSSLVSWQAIYNALFQISSPNSAPARFHNMVDCGVQTECPAGLPQLAHFCTLRSWPLFTNSQYMVGNNSGIQMPSFSINRKKNAVLLNTTECLLRG